MSVEHLQYLGALQRGRVDHVRELLDAGHPPSFAKLSDPVLVDLLLDAGADPTTLEATSAVLGLTPLRRLAARGVADVERHPYAVMRRELHPMLQLAAEHGVCDLSGHISADEIRDWFGFRSIRVLDEDTVATTAFDFLVVEWRRRPDAIFSPARWLDARHHITWIEPDHADDSKVLAVARDVGTLVIDRDRWEVVDTRPLTPEGLIGEADLNPVKIISLPDGSEYRGAGFEGKPVIDAAWTPSGMFAVRHSDADFSHSSQVELTHEAEPGQPELFWQDLRPEGTGLPNDPNQYWETYPGTGVAVTRNGAWLAVPLGRRGKASDWIEIVVFPLGGKGLRERSFYHDGGAGMGATLPRIVGIDDGFILKANQCLVWVSPESGVRTKIDLGSYVHAFDARPSLVVASVDGGIAELPETGNLMRLSHRWPNR